ncbi:MAG: phosphoglucomutase [Ignavibacteriales bacterium]|nr:phosphoglucomutase [Ignavibacteriales bacterium]
MKIQFGTDGWRGLLDKELNAENIERVAQAFAVYTEQSISVTQKTIAISFDGRRHSRYFAAIFARVLSGNNIRVILSDKITPTPVLSYYVLKHNLFAGVIITASHNPPEYNGIKFKNYQGAPFATEETKLVEDLIDTTEARRSEKLIELTDLMPAYLAQIDSMIDFPAIKAAGIRACIDSMGGAGQQVITNILKGHGIPSTSIYHIADENFSGRKAEPITANLEALRQSLQSGGQFDVGLATDGDADRLGVLTETGAWFSAHETILALADYYSAHRGVAGDIIKSSSVTSKIELLHNAHRSVHNVQVGFKYISEKMIETNAAFGAEESGGFGFKGHIPERDGIFSGLMFMEMLAKTGYKNVSTLKKELTKKFGNIFYNRIDFDYHETDRLQILPALFANAPMIIGGFTVERIESFMSSRGVVNGMKFYLEEYRWLLIRCSETEPMFRVYTEAHSDAEVAQLLETGLTFITQNK